MTLNLLGISGAMLSPLQKIGEKTHCYLDNFNLTTFPKPQTLGLVGAFFKTTFQVQSKIPVEKRPFKVNILPFNHLFLI